MSKLPTIEELCKSLRKGDLEGEWFKFSNGFITRKELEAIVEMNDKAAKQEAEFIWNNFKDNT